MPKAYYEFKDKTSSKFWEIDTKGKTVTVRFGKIGTDGQTTAKTFGAPRDATAHAAKVTAEKVKKGYRKTQLKALGAPKTTKRAKMKPPMSAKKASETRTRSGRRSAKQHSTQPTPEQPRKSYWKQFYGAMKIGRAHV